MDQISMDALMQRSHSAAFRRSLVIALTAFLTLVDLFATQAILPSLDEAYGVPPAAMGLAVNASTFGMAAAGLAMAFFSQRIERRIGIFSACACSSIPTVAARICSQSRGLRGAARDAGPLHGDGLQPDARLSRRALHAKDAAGAFAAYITGNVASNLFGRLIAAAVVDHRRPRSELLCVRRASTSSAQRSSISPSTRCRA